MRRHVARGPKDADQDGVADEDRNAERDAEDPVQPASAGGRSRPRGRNGAVYLGGVGQLEIRGRAGL